MKIALIQTNLIWENPSQNRTSLEEKIDSIKEPVDLIVLPEMFTTGFTMHPNDVFDTMESETVNWLLKMSKKGNFAIMGSFVVRENSNYYNRLLFVQPDGIIFKYDKRHLFTLAGEEKAYTAGTTKLIIDYKGFKICPLICYDLRFPVFSRNVEGYDVLIYVANWPKARINAWDILLKARAVENMSYVIGVNRVGMDDNKHEYVGHSQAIDFLGNYIVEPSEVEAVIMVELDKEKMLVTRRNLAFLNDKDEFEIV